MSLYLPPLEISGCNAKMRLRDLGLITSLKRKELVSKLAVDAEELSFKNYYFSIDAITPVSSNPENFGVISTLHALNDLFALGIKPLDVGITYGFDTSSFPGDDQKNIIAGVNKTLKSLNINLSNMHTYKNSTVLITIAAIGKYKKKFPTMRFGRKYSLILTKPLGASTTNYFAQNSGSLDIVKKCEKQMMMNHAVLLELFRKYCFKGTTDISGYGLIGHLSALAINQNCQVEISLNRFPFVNDYFEITSTKKFNCSSQNNLEDFDGIYEFNKEPLEKVEQLLFGAETAGPISCVVEESEREVFLKALKVKGFNDAQHIGVVTLSDKPIVRICD